MNYNDNFSYVIGIGGTILILLIGSVITAIVVRCNRSRVTVHPQIPVL